MVIEGFAVNPSKRQYSPILLRGKGKIEICSKEIQIAGKYVCLNYSEMPKLQLVAEYSGIIFIIRGVTVICITYVGHCTCSGYLVMHAQEKL